MTDTSADPRATAVVIGAGPAGLTAAYELLTRASIRPIVLEADDQVGGLARTCVFKGNRIDIGGHRFFTKSDRVMDWWLARLPLERTDGPVEITYHHQHREVQAGPPPDPGHARAEMLVRERRSRVYYLRRFFNYPITLSVDTVRKLGFARTAAIGASYLWARAFPIRPERNLEEFFVNRFGRRLYRTFFRDYTEKVWGVPCDQIGAEWGAQRVKGLSLSSALRHAIASLRPGRATGDMRQKDTETSLIERFLYPRLGPGQMWETVAAEVIARGGELHFSWTVDRIEMEHDRVVAVHALHRPTGRRRRFAGDWCFSTMPIRDLVRGFDAPVPKAVRDVAEGLVYRDFITVGLLVRRMRVTEAGARAVRDNWIYIQEPDVRVGRLQIFNNWSPAMVADPGTVWLGLEYFCNEGDALWSRSDEELMRLGGEELETIGLVDRAEILDATVIRMPKTYPAYFGTYDRLGEVRAHVDRIANLFLIGRNGMHRYNNQDHSMLTAMTAVDNILAGRTNKDNLWEINTEQDYHEEKA